MSIKPAITAIAVLAASTTAFATMHFGQFGAEALSKEEISSIPATATENTSSISVDQEKTGLQAYLVGEMSDVIEFGDQLPLTEHLIFNEEEELFKFKELKGKAMLVNFWASWCAPCRFEMPALQRLQEAVGDDKFEVVTINVDRAGFQKANEALKEWGVEGLTVYNDPTMKIAFDLAQGALPSSFIIDKDGNFRALYIGVLEWDSPDAVNLFTALKEGKI